MLVSPLAAGISSKGAFLTHLDDSFQSDAQENPSAQAEVQDLTRQLAELKAEKVNLQTQISQTLQKLSDQRSHPRAKTGFVPLAPIFPLKRDAFTEGRSAEKQLTIYCKEWHRVQRRYLRTSDTSYSYSLEHDVQTKTGEIKELEQTRIGLIASNKSLERELVRTKSDDAIAAEAANMTALVAHLTMLRDQVRSLEDVEEQNLELFQSSTEALDSAERRYRKVKAVASQMGLSLVEPKPNSLKEAYDALVKRLASMEKQGCYKEQLRIRELNREKKRLLELEEQLRTLFIDQETNLDRVRIELSQMHRENQGVQRPAMLMSMSTSKLTKDILIPNTNRMGETTMQFEDRAGFESVEAAEGEELS